MKNKWKGLAVLAVLAAGIWVSCASTGQYMPLKPSETVIGTVQASFVAKDTWFSKDAINTQAYIKLLEEAQKKYPGNVDVRDILWASGRDVDQQQNKEFSATAKVIQVE